MNIDAISLSNTMTEAASKAAGVCWLPVRTLGESELRRFAGTLEDVHRLHAAGVIEKDEAADIACLHSITAMAVLCSTQSLGDRRARAIARRAMKAAISAAREIVNPVAGFQLL